MPNTKSAEKRMRSTVRKQARNQMVKSSLRTAEKKYRTALVSGNADEGSTAYKNASSAFDKAAKRGVIHPNKASRQKSRMARGLKASAAPKG